MVSATALCPVHTFVLSTSCIGPICFCTSPKHSSVCRWNPSFGFAKMSGFISLKPGFQSYIRGAIKKFSAWPSYVQNKIKIVFASYSSKAQNTTCTIWLLGYKYFVHFSGRWLSAVEVKKAELCRVMKWQFCLIHSFHCMLCFLTQNRSCASTFHPE